MRQPARPAAAAAESEFVRQHYATHADIDAIFHSFHLVLLALAIKLNPAKLALYIQTAFAISVACLALNLLHRPRYLRLRPILVFMVHFVNINLRVICVSLMQAEQAVHWRTNKGSGDPSGDTAFPYLVSMCNTSGALLRLFEVVGLQQPFWLHAVLSPYLLLMQAVSSLSGFRLAYANALFYSCHEAHDAVAGVLDTLLEALVPLPITQQHTCSSCPGVAVYLTVLSYTACVIPLYLSYVIEKSARQRYLRTSAAAAVAPAAAQDVNGAALTSIQQQQLGQSSAAAAAAVATGLSDTDRQSATVHGSAARTAAASEQQQQRHLGEGVNAAEEEQHWRSALEAADSDASVGSYLGSWAVHVVVLVVSLFLCWTISNVLALVLLPKVLSSEQLNRWCPNRPRVPFRIAAEEYYGGG